MLKRSQDVTVKESGERLHQTRKDQMVNAVRTGGCWPGTIGSLKRSEERSAYGVGKRRKPGGFCKGVARLLRGSQGRDKADRNGVSEMEEV